MVTMLPEPGAAVAEPMSAALGEAISGGAAEPSFVAVATDVGAWRRASVARSRGDRCRAVLATSSNLGLADGIALAFGGAVYLPPSTAAVIEALEAAAGAPPIPPLADAAVVETIFGSAGEVIAVSVENGWLWRSQLGDRRLEILLQSLASGIDAPVLLLPGPVLIVPMTDDVTLRKAWDDTCEEFPVARGIELKNAKLAITKAKDIVLEAGQAMCRRQEADAPRSVVSRPVYELPSGRRVGWWSMNPRETRIGGEWEAHPTAVSGRGCRWVLHRDGEADLEVDDVIVPEDVAAGPAVRVAGWIADRPTVGSPSGLLLTRLATAAARVGLPLWVPNVDGPGLRFLQRLGTTVWVDGPAVPED